MKINAAVKTNIVWSLLLLAYVDLLPYASRIYRGTDWVAQYLPDRGHLIFGLIFFGCFASLPGVPLIVTFWLRRRLPVTFAVAFCLMTGLLVTLHHDYDLAADAQAAIGLVFMPIYVGILTSVVALLTGIVELTGRRRADRKK